MKNYFQSFKGNFARLSSSLVGKAKGLILKAPKESKEFSAAKTEISHIVTCAITSSQGKTYPRKQMWAALCLDPKVTFGTRKPQLQEYLSSLSAKGLSKEEQDRASAYAYACVRRVWQRAEEMHGKSQRKVAMVISAVREQEKKVQESLGLDKE